VDGKIRQWPAGSGQRIRDSKRWLSCSDSNREALVVSCAFRRLSMNACPEAQAGGANRGGPGLSCRSRLVLPPGQEGLECRAHSRRPSWCLVVSPFEINSWAADPRGTSAHTVDSNQQPNRSRSALAGQRGRRRFPRSTIRLSFSHCLSISLSLCVNMGPGRGKGAAMRALRGNGIGQRLLDSSETWRGEKGRSVSWGGEQRSKLRLADAVEDVSDRRGVRSGSRT